MTDEEFKKEVSDLMELLESHHRIRDKSLTKWIKREIRYKINSLLNEN